MERLQCHVQNYAWGKKGLNSEVARVYVAGHDVQIDDNTSYAEVHKSNKRFAIRFFLEIIYCFCISFFQLWMGTHPDGPAKVKNTNVELSKHIADTETSVYERTNKETHLPFIMKLMSIDKTLSIQVHPTKVTLK